MERWSWRGVAGMAAAATVALAAATAPAQAAPTPVRGVNVHMWTNSYDHAVIEQELDHAVALGANTVRVDVGWQNLEPSQKGQYDFGWYVPQLDFFMNEADERGLKVIATLQTTPGWASTPRSGQADSEWLPPSDPDDYGDVAAWVATRYGAKLRALEVWNEPNLCASNTAPITDCSEIPGSSSFFWRTDVPGDTLNHEAEKYAELLAAAYSAVKAASPGTTVLAGSLAYADGDFLQDLYDHGIAGDYDAISFHPYNESRAPADSGDPSFRKYSLIAGLEWVRSVQAANGDTKPQWLTEFGWSTCVTGRCVTAANQAAYLEDSWPLLKSRSYVQAGIVYTLRNEGTDTSEYSNFGVLTNAFGLKSSYAALQRAWTAPNTTITSSPPASTNVRRPSWSFTSSDAGSRFECQVDSGAWTACTSPYTPSSDLAAGARTFRVRAIDPADNVDATPASSTVTIDVTAPDTTITSGPAAGAVATSASATFAFTASESGSGFECKLDAGAWAACTSPRTLSGLANGTHTLSVRAKDAAGNTDASPASRTWEVDTTYGGQVRSVGGLRGWWRMNETTGSAMNDASGLGHHGGYFGPFSLGTGGIASGGTAASFASGADAWIDHHADFALNAFTIELWVNLSAYGNTAEYRPLFYKGNGVDRNYSLFLAGGSNAKLHGSIYTTGGQYVAVNGTTNIPLNGWHHVALTHEANGAMKVYLDGQLEGTSAATAITPSTSGTNGISLLAGWEPVGAKLDEVALYDRAMTATQVQQHYTRGTQP